MFLKLKSVAPRVPVLFPAMLSFEQVHPALERIANQANIQTTIKGIEPPPPATAAAQLGRPENFLYLSKDDLPSLERRGAAALLIQRHFR